MILKKYEHLIVKDLPRMGTVAGKAERFPFWLTGEMFPEVKIRVVAKDASRMVDQPRSSPHTHETAQVYVSITETPGDIEFEVQLEDETYVLESPFVVFLPAGLAHAHKVLRCDEPSHMLIIFLDYLLDDEAGTPMPD